VAFAAATWGGAFDPNAGPVTQAQTIGAAILDRIAGAIGVPTDDMAAADPFDQYRRAVAGSDQVDSVGLAAIYAHALNSLGFAARVVGMDRAIQDEGVLVIDGAPSHAGVELYDAVDDRWVYFDLSSGVLGVTQAGIGLLNSAKLSRAAVDPAQTGTLTIVAYDEVAGVSPLPFASSSVGAFLTQYFQLAPRLRFARSAP
jgi:hypothetical protein